MFAYVRVSLKGRWKNEILFKTDIKSADRDSMYRNINLAFCNYL